MVEENYKLLKAKVGQIDLRELLRPQFAQLLEETINMTDVALILYKKDTMSRKKLKKCMSESLILFQNLEIYRAVKNKNAGEALIDALYETGNFHILELLQQTLDQPVFKQPLDHFKEITNTFVDFKSDNFNIPVKDLEPIVKEAAPKTAETSKETNNLSPAESPASKSKQVLILRSPHNSTKSLVPESCTLDYSKTIGVENLRRLQVDSLDGVLVRVVTTCEIDDSREYLNFIDDRLDNERAIAKFLETHLELDMEKKKLGKQVREIYMDIRTFSAQGYEWLTKFLLNYCRDTLEHLWLYGVTTTELYEGTKWMNNFDTRENPQIWFPKLKVFIFERYQCSPDTLNALTVCMIWRLIISPYFEFE